MSNQKVSKIVMLPRALTVRQLADLLGVSPIGLIKQLMRQGVMAGLNQVIDYEAAASAAKAYGYEPQLKLPERETAERPLPKEGAAAQKPRPPVITILGHVDHGKTSLLDYIRKSNIVASEPGAITQHIGAYQVEFQGQKLTFIDTPGHEAFTALRARGAKVTDIAVLVVAADDGVMPQTIEAINHARAADVPLVVAINKIDKADADPEKAKRQLAENGVVVEEWGGDTVCVAISAKTGQGIPDLLESLLLVAEMAELKANPDAPARGVVIESRLDPNRGPLATVIVQDGTLRVGDVVVVGDTCWGKVRAMFDESGKRLKEAGPSTPVELLGLVSIPQAGDPFNTVPSEKEAKALVEKRLREQELLRTRTATLSEVSAQVRTGEAKGLNLILKADAQGSVEAIRDSLEQLEVGDIRVRIIHAGIGGITENDVMLALASQAVIIGFNTRVEPGAKKLAEQEGVEIRRYRVIYELLDDVQKALSGLLEPTYVEVVEGRAEVRAVFPIRGGKVAGVYVLEGKAVRGAQARVIRRGEVIHDSVVSSLKHFKDNVPEMPAGSECGVGLEGFSEFQVGDIIEFYRKERK